MLAPVGFPGAAKARVILMVLRCVSHGVRGVSSGVAKIRFGARVPVKRRLRRQADRLVKPSLGGGRRNAHGCWGGFMGVKHLHLCFAFEDAGGV